MKNPFLLATLLLAPFATAQVRPATDRATADRTAAGGVTTRIASVAHFRGVVANQLIGVGLVAGLSGTGDTKRFLSTQRANINLLRQQGMDVDPSQSESKNTALVHLYAELPAFASPGTKMDVLVSAMGDCQSLRGGTLVVSFLKYPNADNTIYATAAGPISIGSSGASAGGGVASRGFFTAGNIPGGAIIQRGVPTKTEFDGKMYLDLEAPNATTAKNMEEAINRRFPQYKAFALDPGCVELTLPKGKSSNTAQAEIGSVEAYAETEALVVVNEKTGTIVMGGDIRVSAFSFAKGGLSINIRNEPFISQPEAYSNGKTVVGSVKTVAVEEQSVETAYLPARTSVADLARLFQALRLKADDVINILQQMHAEGALKARLVVR